MEPKLFSVYILTNRMKTVLYIGVTSDLRKRIAQHRTKAIDGFAKKYQCTMLVYYEMIDGSYAAITREKELKGWRRERKNALIAVNNPEWNDLYETLW